MGITNLIAQIKPDDITIIVVDVNPAAFDEVSAKGIMSSVTSSVSGYFTNIFGVKL